MTIKTDHMNVEAVNVCTILYNDDTIVRKQGVEVIRRISEKVAAKAFEAKQGPLDNPEHTDELEEALNYAVSALESVAHVLGFASGGYVGRDDKTSLFFQGFLIGAAIDRDTHFSIHT